MLLIRQLMDLAGAPVEQGNVILRAVLGLVGKSDRVAVVRPMRVLLANRRRVGQVERLAAIARYSVKVPEFVACAVLLVNDPLPIGRPDGVVLPIVGLDKLNRPTAGRAHFP